MLHREIYNVVPPRVEYSLTAMGKSLIKPLEDLCHWAKAHIEERDAARRRFDGWDAGNTGTAPLRSGNRGEAVGPQFRSLPGMGKPRTRK